MGDAVVLQRLMGLLTTPLSAGMSLGLTAQPFAEWVGVRATVALLEAHALCTLAAEKSQDEAAKSIISKAHAPHRRWTEFQLHVCSVVHCALMLFLLLCLKQCSQSTCTLDIDSQAAAT